jgi:hypothetical protein
LDWEKITWAAAGGIYVRGIVKNKSNSLLDGWIRCNFYDINGTYLGYDREYFGVGVGVASDFELVFTGKYAKYAESASLEVDAEKTHVSGDTEKTEITIFSLEPVYTVYVRGTAKNKADTMQNISIKAQFYDKDGKLLGEGVDNESRVPAGYTWHFSISFRDIGWSDVPYGGHVSFEIESKETRE